MSIALRTPRMTRAEFFDWADSREGRYEFDGFQPVAMVGATRNHGRIAQNIYSALRTRLRGGPCEVLGSDAGLATIGDAVRYPDALVSCTNGPGADRVIPGVVVVFEVLSPTSGRIDRIVKLREYRAVSSIRRYVIVEYARIGLMSFELTNGSDDWTATALAPATSRGCPKSASRFRSRTSTKASMLPMRTAKRRRRAIRLTAFRLPPPQQEHRLFAEQIG